MKWPWRRQEKLSEEVLELEKSLRETKLLIAQAYAGFNSAADSELVESYVYEIQALQARYSYLLRQRKALDAGAAGKQTVQRSKAPHPAAEKLRTAESPARPVLPVA